MEWVLCLGHAALGALLLPFGFAGRSTRRRAVELASVAGVALGVALVVAGDVGGAGWRTVTFEASTATTAGLAATAAWIVTGALAHRGPRVDEAALVGVAASGLVLAATGRWVVPALIFWLCSSAALAASGRPRGRWTWVVLAASDAAVCVAAALHVWGEESWAFDVAGGPAVPALVAAAVIRGGAHVAAPWPSLATGSGAAAPLMAGGAVALAAHAATSEPWVSATLLVAALATAVAGLVKSRVGPSLIVTWATTLALAACFVSPSHAPLAGAAAVLAAAVAALWPHTAGRGGVARALAVSAVPLTAGFGMVAGAGTEAFERATAGGGAAHAVVAVLLPVTLAAGAVLGGRAARADVGELVPEAVLATWLLLGAAVGIGVLPHAAGDAGVLGDSGGTIALQVAALAAGAAAGIAARRPGVPVEPAYAEVTLAELAAAPDLPRGAEWATLALAVATAAAAGWLTVAGLRVGFL